MRWVTFITIFLIVMEAVTPQAWAEGAAQSYQGNILFLLFLGVCMLIVVSQLVPALIVLLEALSGFAKRVADRKQAVMIEVSQDKTK